MEIPVSQVLYQGSSRDLEQIADGPPYFLRLRELQFAAPWMQLLAEGNRLIVAAEEWVNKSSGRGSITLFTEDHRGTEIVLQHWYWAIFFPGWTYEEALARFFPWAELSNDEEFYDESDYEHFQEECERYDREDDVHYYHESFAEWKAARDLTVLRPYQNDGEVASWRLTLKLNELGKAFLRIHVYLSEIN